MTEQQRVGENEDRWGLSVMWGWRRQRIEDRGQREKRNVVDTQFCRLHESSGFVWTSCVAYLEST